MVLRAAAPDCAPSALASSFRPRGGKTDEDAPGNRYPRRNFLFRVGRSEQWFAGEFHAGDSDRSRLLIDPLDLSLLGSISSVAVSLPNRRLGQLALLPYQFRPRGAWRSFRLSPRIRALFSSRLCLRRGGERIYRVIFLIIAAATVGSIWAIMAATLRSGILRKISMTRMSSC